MLYVISFSARSQRKKKKYTRDTSLFSYIIYDDGTKMKWRSQKRSRRKRKKKTKEEEELLAAFHPASTCYSSSCYRGREDTFSIDLEPR
jgi:hypothetical protein